MRAHVTIRQCEDAIDEVFHQMQASPSAVERTSPEGTPLDIYRFVRGRQDVVIVAFASSVVVEIATERFLSVVA